jgi:hypothetical protein
MQRFYKDNKKAILIVAGLSAAAAAIAGVYFTLQKKKAAKVVTPVEIAHNGQLTKLERANIIAQIKVEYEGDHLTVETIKQISEAVVKFSIPEFVEITKKDREERRANRENLEVYVKLWDTYTQNLEEIVEKNQKAVLRELNISDKVFEDSNSFHITNNNQELFMLHANLPYRLKASLKATKKLTLDELKTILRAQIEATNEEALNIARLSEKTKHPEEAVPILNNRVYDTIQAKFLVEEEDLTVAAQNFSENKDIQGLFIELQTANMKLLPLGELF